jgi:CMP-N,N'-diacetyllegionaminic acid synthase
VNEILFVIPARSNSSRLKNKNLRLIGGNSLIVKKIKSCVSTKLGKVIVSTNSKKIANIAKKNGALVPYLRPKNYSKSDSTMMSCILHLIKFLQNTGYKLPRYIGVLPPTCPFVSPKSIIKAYNKLKKNKKLISICSFTSSFDHPFLYVRHKKKLEFNVIKYNGKTLSKVERTQDFPKSSVVSGAIRISKTSYFLKFTKNFTPKIKNHVIDFKSCLGIKISQREAFDINTYHNLKLAVILNKNKDLKL